MKAEPESRIEKGKDIKFSIDDLAAKTDPEPWDGKHLHPIIFDVRTLTGYTGIRNFAGTIPSMSRS